MKKLLFFLAALMFVTSCAKDTTSTPEVKGEKVVSFKVTSPKMQTRYGEGAEANKLFWAVYKDGQRLDNVSVIDPAEAVAINMSADVEITLMEGIDYDILFWAQNEHAPYTFDGEKVTIDYDALSANEEIYDAFFRNYHVDSEQTEPHRVELRRPFAQLNIGTADTAKAQSASFTVENTSITVETCTVLDLATGEASEPQEITFEMNTKADDTYGEAPDTFDIISMNYLLVNNDKVMTTVTFNAEGGNDTIEREYLNVPLQRNHRTYILGDILTSSKLFNVYINPAFEDEDYIFDTDVEYAIYYTSSSGNIVKPNMYKDEIILLSDIEVFGANIIGNTYKNGQGKITFDGPVTKIGDEAFKWRGELTSMIIPNGVTKIGDNAFHFCNNMTSITIPDSVTEIGAWAFDCCKLTNITIPDSVTTCGDNIIHNFSNLDTIYSKYASADNRCLIINGVLNSFARAGLTTYTIPDGVTSIGAWAFDNCKDLENINIPEGVNSIGKFAFSSCSNLMSVTIPDSVTEIGEAAFDSCSKVTDITIGANVSSIGAHAFSYCEKLTSITIPENVTYIGYGAFSSCENMSTIYCKPTTPPTTGYEYDSVWAAFIENAPDFKIYVPTESLDAYKNADGWKDYADRIFDGEF